MSNLLRENPLSSCYFNLSFILVQAKNNAKINGMKRITLLHSNDIHGVVEGIAHIATLVNTIQLEAPDVPVVYIDAGDCQDRHSVLSEATQGVAMYRLLRLAGCCLAVVGNKRLRAYGIEVIERYASAAGFPLLAANIFMRDGSPIKGTHPSTIINVDGLKLGVIGITTPYGSYVQHYGLKAKPALQTIRVQMKILEQAGADATILLSHMGLDVDYHLASKLQGKVALIVGGHSHILLPDGERIGAVHVVHAGSHGRFLGRVDLQWDGHLHIEQMTVLPVNQDIAPAPAILREIERIKDAQP